MLAAISRALTEARGDYVLSTAADDWILPELLESAGAQFARHPEAGLCSGLSLVTDETGATPRIFLDAIAAGVTGLHRAPAGPALAAARR